MILNETLCSCSDDPRCIQCHMTSHIFGEKVQGCFFRKQQILGNTGIEERDAVPFAGSRLKWHSTLGLFKLLSCARHTQHERIFQCIMMWQHKHRRARCSTFRWVATKVALHSWPLQVAVKADEHVLMK